MAFAQSSFWCLICLFSFIGWGKILHLRLNPQENFHLGKRIVEGMSLLIVLGGILNLFSFISRPLIFTLIVPFSFIGFRETLRQSYRRQWFGQKLHFYVPLFFFGLTRILGSLWSIDFNIHDDFHGYLVFPFKMLATGSIGNSPFSEHRMVSLGGHSFLQSLLLSGGAVESLRFLEGGIALLALFSFVLPKSGQPFPLLSSVFVSILCLLVTHFPEANSSSLISSMAFMFYLLDFFYCENSRNNHPGLWLPLSLVTGAFVALKGINLLNLTILCLPIIICSEKRKSFLMGSFLGAVAILPWMLSLYRSSGTLFYPVLGSGFHGSTYLNYVLVHSQSFDGLTFLKRSPWLIATFAIGLTSFSTPGFKPSESWKIFYFPAAITLGAYFLATRMAERHCVRYLFPIGFTTLLFWTCYSFETALLDRKRRRIILFGQLLVTLVCFGFNYGRRDFLSNFQFGVFANPLDSNRVANRYRGLLDSVPSGSRILARTDKPYLLDFKKHDIWVLDWPGGSSPPPGTPFQKGAEAYAHYLSSLGIKYIVYSYSNQANFGPSFKDWLTYDFDPWSQSVARHTFDWNQVLEELGKSRKRIYDDGTHFVVSLNESSQTFVK